MHIHLKRKKVEHSSIVQVTENINAKMLLAFSQTFSLQGMFFVLEKMFRKEVGSMSSFRLFENTAIELCLQTVT